MPISTFARKKNPKILSKISAIPSLNGNTPQMIFSPATTPIFASANEKFDSTKLIALLLQKSNAARAQNTARIALKIISLL